MRDPYLQKSCDVLDNLLGITSQEELRQAEADITNLSMNSVYNKTYYKFDSKTLCRIHRSIFGCLYAWAGKFRTIQMIKPEYVLGGDTVQYAYPGEIKAQLKEIMKELAKLNRDSMNDHELVCKLSRIIGRIWHIHPFREGNTRSVIVFAILYAQSIGFQVDHELFKENANFVRGALVWTTQGIYSRYEYLERIFCDAILHEEFTSKGQNETTTSNYSSIEGYHVKDYEERPHIYVEK